MAAQEEVGRGRHARLLHQLLGERLRSLQLGRRPGRAEGGDARRLERVDDADDEGRLGPDHDQVDAPIARQRDDRLDVFDPDLREDLGVGPDPGVARRAEQLRRRRRARQCPHDRVLATATADYKCLQPVRSVAGIAVSVRLVIVPRDPSSTEIFAIVCSSGASITVTKS